MISIKEELSKNGLYAEKSYNELCICVKRIDNDDIAFKIMGSELSPTYSPEYNLELVKSKVKEYEEEIKKGL